MCSIERIAGSGSPHCVTQSGNRWVLVGQSRFHSCPVNDHLRQKCSRCEELNWVRARLGVDAESGLVRTAGVTTRKVHSAKVMAILIRATDTAVHGAKGYASDQKARAAENAKVLRAV
jgi:hypothetical protein